MAKDRPLLSSGQDSRKGPVDAVLPRGGQGEHRHRLAYFVSHPIQYQAPLLRYLAARPEFDLTVFFLSDVSVGPYYDHGFRTHVQWDVPLLEGYPYSFLPALGRRDRLTLLRPVSIGIKRALKEGRFEAVWIHGWAHHGVLRAAVIAKSMKLAVLLRGEATLMDRPRGRLKEGLRQFLLRRLFHYVDGFLAIGTRNREFYRAMDVPAERIFSVPYAVDNDFFQSRVAAARGSRDALRAELGLSPGGPVILYASKLEGRKRPMDLLQAFERVVKGRRQIRDAYLLYAGDGSERRRLEAVARNRGLNRVRFLGFKNQSDLPRLYDLADVFVLSSQWEPWGLVVNEVMNAAKPVIVTDRVGAASDLVEDGRNGFVVPMGDISSLADRIDTVLRYPEMAKEMGDHSLRRISEWNFGSDAEGLLTSLRANRAVLR